MPPSTKPTRLRRRWEEREREVDAAALFVHGAPRLRLSRARRRRTASRWSVFIRKVPRHPLYITRLSPLVVCVSLWLQVWLWQQRLGFRYYLAAALCPLWLQRFGMFGMSPLFMLPCHAALSCRLFMSALELWSNGAIVCAATTAATASSIVGLLRWLCSSAFHAVSLEPLIPLRRRSGAVNWLVMPTLWTGYDPSGFSCWRGG